MQAGKRWSAEQPNSEVICRRREYRKKLPSKLERDQEKKRKKLERYLRRIQPSS
jgi:hypothetical protein